jgi:hypothetical protein
VDQGAQRRCGVCCPYVLPPLMHGPCCRSCLPCVDSPCRGVAQHRALQASPAAQPLAHCGTCPVQMQRCRCMCGCCCLCTALQELMERLRRPQPLAVRVSGDHQQQLQQHAAAGSSWEQLAATIRLQVLSLPGGSAISAQPALRSKQPRKSLPAAPEAPGHHSWEGLQSVILMGGGIGVSDKGEVQHAGQVAPACLLACSIATCEPPLAG